MRTSILVPVTLILALEDQYAIEGDEEATFMCAISDPEAEVTWYRESEALSADDKYDMVAEGARRKLVIRDIHTKDQTKYSCASNSDRTEANLFVEAFVDFCPGLEDQYAIEQDAQAQFSCKMTQPDAEATWFWNEQKIEKSEKYEILADGYEHTLIIKDISLKDELSYSCASKHRKTTAKLFVEALVDFCPGLEDQYAIEQDAQAQFSCQMTQPDAEATWFRKDQKLENSEKYEILVDGYDHTLIIKDITLKDELSYSCASKHRKTTAKLFVEALIDFCPGLEDQFAIEFDAQAQFFCKMTKPDAEATWYREEEKLENSEKYQIVVNGYDHYLTIKDIRQEDDMSYSCASKHRKTTAKLIVGELVDFSPGLEDQYALENDAQAQFSCKMTQPDAEATWYKADEKIENSEKYEILADGYDHTLIIKDIQLKDETSYSCESRHRKTTAKLFVEALLDFRPGLEDRYAIEHDAQAQFTCQMTQSNAEATWYKDDEKLEGSEKYQIIMDGYEHALIIKDIRLEDETSYSCECKHRKTTAKLFVEELVDFCPGLEDQHALECDAQAQFSCKMTKPDAEATWCKADEKIENSHKYEIIVDGYDHTLIIKDIQLKDETSYSCASRHRKTTAKLFVEALLDIRHLEDQYAVENDMQAQFMCQLTQPDVPATWYKNDEILENSDKYKIVVVGFVHSLSIRPVEMEDAASYSCASKHRKTTAQLYVEALLDFCPGLQDQYAIEYDAQAQFSCKMNKPDVEVTWYKNQEKLENSKKYEIIMDGHDHTLIIKDIRHDDDTTYSCASKHRKTTAKLIVGELVDFCPGLEDQYALEHDAQAQFSCKMSESEAKATWYRDGDTRIKPSEKYHVLVDGYDHSLVIKDIRLDDQTSYSCESKHRKTTAQLFVEGTDKTTDEVSAHVLLALHDFCPGLEDQYAIEYDAQAQFSCKMTYPDAEVTWYKDDQKLENSEKYEILLDGHNHYLIIKDVRMDDHTTYSCESKHRKTTAKLFVEELIDFCPGLEDQYAIEYDAQAQFSCKTTKPNAETTWYKGDQKLENSDKYEILVDGYDHTLIIKDIRMDDDTVYSCESKHRKTSALLFVEALVDFCPGLEDQYAIEYDDQAQFSCKMTQPDAEATWCRDDVKIENSEKYEILVDGYDHTLVIKDIRLEDETSYSCASKHRKTTAKMFVEALVDFCPGLEDQYAIEKDAQAQFSCKMTQSDAKATWFKDDEKIEDSEKYEIIVDGYDHSLTIKDIQLKDETSYSCVSKHRTTTAKLFVEALVDLSQGLTDQYAVEGDASAVFACEMSTSAADSAATWYREEDVLEPSDKYEIRADGNIHRLVIKDVKTVDETHYSCASKHRKTTANLYVEALLDFCPGLEDQYAIEYDAQAQFSCKMTLPNAEATWYKDEEKIEYSEKYEILVDGQVHSLTIKDIRLDDDMSYSCASKHRKTTAKLFVEALADFRQGLEDQHAVEGDEKAQFSCEMSVFDSPAVWYREETKLEASSKYQLEQDGNFHYLTIRDVVKEDQTNYSCESKHRKSTANLFVEALISFEQGLEDQYAIEGDAKSTFTCEMSQPGESATWYRKDDEELQENDKYKMSAVGNLHTLVIQDILLDDQTMYTCASRHRKTSAKLYVEGVIDFEPGLEDQYAVEFDKQAKFSCKMTTTPAEATWYRGEDVIEVLYPSDKFEIINDGYEHHLIIKDIKLTDQTVYTCASKHRKTSANLFVEGTFVVYKCDAALKVLFVAACFCLRFIVLFLCSWIIFLPLGDA
ncbi:obscurin-like [Branchiostoma lanceolatum]|uniref:obscurin-like n=1 Tax=Branchiostoma lanceolatum TaxID=7740 RepID=UPI0034559864